MARFLLLAVLMLPLQAADDSLNQLLNNVERHYNGVRTLQVSFHEAYSGAGRPQRAEWGELFLRKPGKMRWEYSAPAGKLFLSDGKQVYYFNPQNHTAERMKMKETEDLRAPLAFLLGRLDFQKDFRDFARRSEGGNTVISANPKSDRVPYKHVEFAVSPQLEIRRLIVTASDNALLTFDFTNERMNPGLSDDLFRFRLPVGAKWLDSAAETAGR